MNEQTDTDCRGPEAGEPHSARLADGAFWLPATVIIFSACVTALTRPLWYDEIGTETVARLHSFGAIYAALRVAADAQPPLFFWTTGLSDSIPVPKEFGLRAPALPAFSALIMSLYFFTRRDGGPSQPCFQLRYRFVGRVVLRI